VRGSPTINDVAEPTALPVAGVRGVIFDWGGVVTSPIADTVTAWLEAERIDRASYAAAMRPWVHRAYGSQQEESPIHGLERGEMDIAVFEATLAALLVSLDGQPVPATGLLQRMFAASSVQAEMVDLITDLRASGLRTAMLSNSWGVADGYPWDLLGDLFDDLVISGEVHMRKPEERIFRLACDRLGLAPAQCVFIDDVEANILAAQALGFTTVHHIEAAQTRAELTGLLGSSLSGNGLAGSDA
jgi:putative hydrolase of the HAD superfamily